jgi:Carboxypeptidase regulatory-like domain
MTSAFLIAKLLLTLAMPGTAAAERGELCFAAQRGAAPECHATVGMSFRVATKDIERDFVWTRSDKSAVAIGTLPPKSYEIALTGQSWIPLNIVMRSRSTERWPQNVTVTFRIAGRPHDAVIAAATTGPLRRLFVPRGVEALELEAAHHRPITLRVTEKRTVASFESYPEIIGTVVDAANGAPVAGAAIVSPKDAGLGVTSSTGRFRLDIVDEWPPYVRVSAPSYAPKTVSLPAAVASFDAGNIRIGQGGVIRLLVDGDYDVDVDLVRQGGRNRTVLLSKKTVEHHAEFEAVEAGDYALVLHGTQPLQWLAVTASVREGETTERKVRITPHTFSFRVRSGQKAVEGAGVMISPASGDWQSMVTTGKDGDYDGDLWQVGEFIAFIHSESPPIEAADHRDLTGDPIAWDVNIAALKISGKVVDVEDGPIGKAAVLLESKAGDSAGQQGATTAQDGTFEFPSVTPGEQTLSIRADGFLPSTTSFALAESDQPYSGTFHLRRGSSKAIDVLNSDGGPAANASVFDESGIEGERLTDAAGRVVIQLEQGERKTLYVFPVVGSFAVVDVAASSDSDSAPVIVNVLPGNATIVVNTESDGGNVIGGVAFAFRYEGRFISMPLRLAASIRRGIPVRTGTDGVAILRNMPGGLYEVWPYFTQEEYSSIASGQAPAPVRLGATAGVNTVRLTFSH